VLEGSGEVAGERAELGDDLLAVLEVTQHVALAEAIGAVVVGERVDAGDGAGVLAPPARKVKESGAAVSNARAN
jgi:hypothetical protein